MNSYAWLLTEAQKIIATSLRVTAGEAKRGYGINRCLELISLSWTNMKLCFTCPRLVCFRTLCHRLVQHVDRPCSAGKYTRFLGRGRALVGGACQFPWCACSHHGRFQAANVMSPNAGQEEMSAAPQFLSVDFRCKDTTDKSPDDGSMW